MPSKRITGTNADPHKRKKRDFERSAANQRTAKFLPHCFLQCHGKFDDPKDFKQQVWCCKFHPKLKNIVATSGGEVVNLIDVNTAKVKSRFTQPNEEFYTVDWTTLTLTNDHEANILACGGCLGFIYLIHTEQFCTYGFFKAHSKPVQTLSFVPGQPTYLLSAGNEKRIYLWDIGTLSLPDYHYAYKKLAVFENLKYSPLKLLTLDNQFLLCASEGGLFCWNLPDGFYSGRANPQLRRYQKVTDIKFPFVDDEPLVDGLVAVSKEVLATKCAQTGTIFLWKPRDVVHDLKSGVKSCTAPILRELKWSNTQQYYINIATCPLQKILLAGDENGSIWLYDCDSDGLSDNKAKKHRPSLLPGELLPPTETLCWPNCIRHDEEEIPDVAKGMVLNEISANYDASFVVAAADNNLVCIYKSTM